MRLADDLPLL